MTPIEAAVRFTAAYIRDGCPGDIAAKKAWEAVVDLWLLRPTEVVTPYPAQQQQWTQFVALSRPAAN